MPKITVTKPIYRTQRAVKGYAEMECTTLKAELEYNDKLILLSNNFDRKGPNQFKTTDGLPIWIRNPSDVIHTHDEVDEVDEEE